MAKSRDFEFRYGLIDDSGFVALMLLHLNRDDSIPVIKILQQSSDLQVQILKAGPSGLCWSTNADVLISDRFAADDPIVLMRISNQRDPTEEVIHPKLDVDAIAWLTYDLDSACPMLFVRPEYCSAVCKFLGLASDGVKRLRRCKGLFQKNFVDLLKYYFLDV